VIKLTVRHFSCQDQSRIADWIALSYHIEKVGEKQFERIIDQMILGVEVVGNIGAGIPINGENSVCISCRMTLLV
jgi:hypothetical protein